MLCIRWCAPLPAQGVVLFWFVSSCAWFSGAVHVIVDVGGRPGVSAALYGGSVVLIGNCIVEVVGCVVVIVVGRLAGRGVMVVPYNVVVVVCVFMVAAEWCNDIRSVAVLVNYAVMVVNVVEEIN